jgi:hypothetical protein
MRFGTGCHELTRCIQHDRASEKDVLGMRRLASLRLQFIDQSMNW